VDRKVFIADLAQRQTQPKNLLSEISIDTMNVRPGTVVPQTAIANGFFRVEGFVQVISLTLGTVADKTTVQAPMPRPEPQYSLLYGPCSALPASAQ
jgi:hypothetical protein